MHNRSTSEVETRDNRFRKNFFKPYEKKYMNPFQLYGLRSKIRNRN